MSIYSPLVTMGFDPELSKVITQGYGPEVTVFVTMLPGIGSSRGNRSSQSSASADDRIIRIRVVADDGYTMVQERSVPLEELKKISITVNEKGSVVHGRDIYLKVKEGKVRLGETKKIRVKVHEASEKSITAS
jgi:hypothetical protein